MDIFIMQHKYRNKYLVVIDGNVYVYKYEEFKFDQPFLSLEAKNIFVGKSKVCEMTEFSGLLTIVLILMAILFHFNVKKNEYVYISRLKIFEFMTDDKIIDYISLLGHNMVPYAFIV